MSTIAVQKRSASIILVALLGVMPAINAAAQIVGPAPGGEAKTVARAVILQNFDPPDCPVVVAAIRLNDGSIQAVCSNSESFRIFSFQNKQLALRCSAAKALGVSC